MVEGVQQGPVLVGTFFTVPPPLPRTLQARDDGPLTPAEQLAIYYIMQNTVADRLVSDLRRHFQHFRPDRLVTTVPLPQGAIPIYVRQIQTLLNR